MSELELAEIPDRDLDEISGGSSDYIGIPRPRPGYPLPGKPIIRPVDPIPCPIYPGPFPIM